MKAAVIYARYSSERQTEQSIEGQLRVCKEYAEKNDMIIVDIYIDRAMTGTNDNRAAFQKMIKDSAKKAWEYLLVYKLDRFSRDKYEMAIHRRTLKNNGVKLVSAMENIPDTPEGIILETLLEGMNQYYSAELSQKVRRGMKESRSKGNFTGGFLLYGYKVENKKILIEPDQAEVVRHIYEKFAAGDLVKNIIQELKDSGILNRGKPFARNTVYHLLKNEKYAGIYRHGDEVFTDIYPRIVPEEIYSIVRAKIEENKYGKHKPNVVYLLKNKLICGYCGKSVNSDSGTARDGTIMRYYKCSGQRCDKTCPQVPIRKELLENLIINTTYEALSSSEQIDALADKILDANKKRLNDQSILNLLTQELNDINKSINNLMKAIEQGIITSSTKERLEQLEERKENISQKILLEKSKTKLLITKTDITKFLKQALQKQAIQMFNTLIKKVILFKDKIEIYYNYIDDKEPGENQVLFFYSVTKSYDVDQHKIGTPAVKLNFRIELYV